MFLGITVNPLDQPHIGCRIYEHTVHGKNVRILTLSSNTRLMAPPRSMPVYRGMEALTERKPLWESA